jgi:F0F1-type ATP synthase membrane subunit b/b'
VAEAREAVRSRVQERREEAFNEARRIREEAARKADEARREAIEKARTEVERSMAVDPQRRNRAVDAVFTLLRQTRTS